MRFCALTPTEISAMTRFAAILALSTALPAAALAHDPALHQSNGAAQESEPAEAAPFEQVRLTDQIVMLEGAGGNVAVVTGADGAYVIDDKVGRVGQAVVRVVTELGGGEIPLVVNTHWHGDHTGGNAALNEAGALIMAHENVRDRLSTEQSNAVRETATPPAPEAAWPVITYTRDVTTHLNGQTARIEHAPNAHTDGDSIIYFVEADVLHMGGIFFNGTYPFIDISSGGSIDGMIEGLERGLVIAGGNTQIIPGHGPLATMDDLQAARDLLIDIRARIQAHVDAGDSLEETLEAAPLRDLDEQYAGFMDGPTVTEIVYRDLTEGLSAAPEDDPLADDAPDTTPGQ